MHYSIEPRDQVYVKGYGFLSFAMIIGKKERGKYSHEHLNIAKISTTNTLKTASKRAIPKAVEATDDLIGNKTAEKITKASQISLNSSSNTAKSKAENIKFDKEIPKER